GSSRNYGESQTEQHWTGIYTHHVSPDRLHGHPPTQKGQKDTLRVMPPLPIGSEHGSSAVKRRQLDGRLPRNGGSSRSKVFSGRFGCFSPAVNTRSSLRPIRLCAYKPSSTNSAADTCTSGASLPPTSSGPSFSINPWMPFKPLKTSWAAALSDKPISPPRSNHCTTCCMFTPAKYSSKVLAMAVRISSLLTLSAPFISPSYSSSSLPVIAGMAAYTSLMRGTAVFSSLRKARRSALEITFSMQLMGKRWLTPERLSTRLSSRATKAIRSITSCTYFGRCKRYPFRLVQASCAV